MLPHRRRQDRNRNARSAQRVEASRCIPTAGLAIKLLLAGLAFWYGYRRGLISGAGIAGLAATWLVTALQEYRRVMFVPTNLFLGRGPCSNEEWEKCGCGARNAKPCRRSS
jgi:hypothetical protein